ncbi:MAG: 30S ribosome-binding factor RbfA [Planctomycetota bacterium]
MPGSSRQLRLASHLHREIATLVSQLDDPRLGMVTITRTEMTGDLQTVTAFWTCLGGLRERKLAMHALESSRPHVRRGFAKAVRTRLLPELKFAYDDQEAKRSNMSSIIDRARRTDSDQGTKPEPPAADPTGAMDPLAPPESPTP